MSDVNSISIQSLELKETKEIPSTFYKRKPYAFCKKCKK